MTQGFTLSYSPYTLPKFMPPKRTLSLPPADLISGAQVSPQKAPICHLPSDILYHILWDLSGGWITLDPTTDAWVFTRVSRSLRIVGLSFANLWSRISLDPDDIRSYKRHAVDVLRTILDRSTGTLNYEDGVLQHGHAQDGGHLRLRVHADTLLVHANLLDILTAYYTRWYSLDLNISLFLLNTLSAQMAPLGFPLLSHLRLSLGSDQTHIPDLDVFSLCPALESVEFDSIPRCRALRLPWGRLKRLVVKERVRSDFLRMLLSAPSLQYAELVSVLPSLHPEDPDDEPLPKSRIISHNSLHTLVLKCIPSAVVLDSLCLPNLVELTLENTAQASFGSLLGFINRSDGCKKLEKITLSGTLFLEDPEGALQRSMSSSSLPSSMPPSPLVENGPAGSPFVPGQGQANLSASPSASAANSNPSTPPVPITATLEEVLKAASSLTTVVLEDWTPVRNPSPYDVFFTALSLGVSAEGDIDGAMGTGLLKEGVSLPGTPALGGGLSALGTPGMALNGGSIGMTPAASLSRSSSLNKGSTPGPFSPGFHGAVGQSALNSFPPVPAIPPHLQRATSHAASPMNPLAGLPPHLANNPHIAAASAHLAAAGIQMTPALAGALSTPAIQSMMPSASNEGTPNQITSAQQIQSPGPFSPGFGVSPAASNPTFASALGNGAIESGQGLTPAAVDAAHGALGIPLVQEEVLLPKLKSLTISNRSRNSFDLHCLAGMVESRWRARVQAQQSQSSSSSATASTATTPTTESPSPLSPRSSSPSSQAQNPSIITSLSLHTDLRLIKNKGSVGRIKALQKEAEDNARKGLGEKVKVYVSAKQWGGI